MPGRPVLDRRGLLRLSAAAGALTVAGCGPNGSRSPGPPATGSPSGPVSPAAAPGTTAAGGRPGWAEGAVVYGVVPPLFGEPAFEAITERLDDLVDLGVRGLWLAPVTRCEPGDFGYAVVDYLDVNPDYGTRDDFRRLVDQAHARGIRVLLDFVPNHTSRQHPFFRDAERRGRNSPYHDFYDRDADGVPTHYFDWTHLPNLNYGNPAVRSYMLAAFAFWVRQFDVDGFRVDAAWGVTERRPDFWPQWSRELKSLKPDLLLLAEASARDGRHLGNGFDAAYDWTTELGRWAWADVWRPGGIPARLDAALTDAGRGTADPAAVFRFLNNNDTGVRFVARYGEGLTRVAAAALLTLPGLPCVYTGDERGAAYDPYEDTAPLSWRERVPGLRDHYRRLIRLRSRTPSLRAGTWQRLPATPDDAVYAYLRQAPGAPPVAVVLNVTGRPVSAQVSLPPSYAGFGGGGVLTDLLTDASVPVPGGPAPLAVALPAWVARILTEPSLGR